MLNLNDKIALVTGASGGIGGAIAKGLHAQGAHVVISGTNKQALDNLAAELKTRVSIEICNLQDDESVTSLIDNVCKAHERLDILVCNAGVTRDNLSLRMNIDDFDSVIKINLHSTFLLNKLAIKKMIKQKIGRIINISFKNTIRKIRV